METNTVTENLANEKLKSTPIQDAPVQDSAQEVLTSDTKKELKALKRKIKELEKTQAEELENFQTTAEQNAAYIKEQEKDINVFYQKAVTAEAKLQKFVQEVGKSLDHVQDTLDIVRKSLQFNLVEMEKVTKERGNSNEH